MTTSTYPHSACDLVKFDSRVRRGEGHGCWNFTHGANWKTAAGEDLRRMAANAGEQVESPTTAQSADCPEVRS